MEVGKSEVELTFLLNMIPIKCLVKIPHPHPPLSNIWEVLGGSNLILL